MAFCKITVIGNLGRDPEMRYTTGGKPVTEFSVAVGHSKPDGSGGWIDEGTDWFRVTVWGDRAERAAESFNKGQKVFVEGRFRSREYDAKDGTKKTSLEITADNVISLERREEGQAERRPAPRPVRTWSPSDDNDLDNLPF